VLVLHLERGRVVIRPSGTEPKLKAYLETVVPVTGDLPAARAQADGQLHELRDAVISMLGL
jgi:phosphomannomutase